MSTRLVDVLINLSQNPFMCEEFRNDPSRVLQQQGLSPAGPESKILIDGNSDAIGMYLAAAKKKKTPAPKKKKTAKKPIRKKKNGGPGNL